MNHSVDRVLNSITNTPLLTTQDNLIQIRDYLAYWNYQEDMAVVSQAKARAFSQETPPTVENGIGLLTIEGSLSYKWDWLSAECGIASYQQILADFQNMIKQGAHTICLDIDSPGGLSHGCFETAMEMRSAADKAGVRIITYVDGMCASAAMGLACVSDEIIMNPMSKIGSIGVVISLYNELPMRVQEGAEVIFVYSGDSKVPYSPDGKLRQDFIDGLQEDTDALYTQFIRHVAQFRPMTEGEVRDTQAKMFRAGDATVKGLADREMTSAEFIEYLATLSEKTQEKESMPLFGWPKKNKPEMSEKESQASLEAAALEESPTQEELLSSEQSNETTNEANMTFEEMMASPEAQAKLEEMAAAKAEAVSSELQAKLAQFESASVESAKMQYKELVAGYSFVGAEAQEKVAAFLYHANAEKMDGVEHVMEALESARNAVEAVVDEELGDSGEALEVDEDAKSKSAVSDLIKNRYNK